MNGNVKAERYKKRHQKQVAAQTEVNTDQLNSNKRIIAGLAMKLYEMEQKVQRMSKRLERAEATARYADYRSSALSTLLQASGTYSEESILNEIESLQIKDFETNSSLDDQQNNLEDAGNGPAENGQQAILTLKLLKDGKELITERVVRSKIELGKNEMLPGIDEALVGMNVGESKRVPLDLQGKTDEAEITLLGLRKAKPAPAADAAAPAENSQQQ